MVDKVRLLKIENSTKGTQTDLGPTEINPQQDYVSAKGLSFEESEDHLIDLDAFGNIQIKDTNFPSGKTFKSFAEDTALKYNASNPSGFETPAQLNARDAANRNRSNHTGTQLASTISNFASTTIATVLSGLSVVTGTVVSTDTILAAFGKLQARINELQSTKYDSSNPSGFETPTQLNARDTANRSRANHTGTQLASTISDFASTVRSTVLTGISFATVAAVLATDSILVAIGKLQAQISAIVFGTQYEYFEDLTPFSTTSNTLVQAAVFSASFINGHQYRINMQWNFTTTSQASSAGFQLYINGVAIGSSILIELKDPTDDQTKNMFVKYTAPTTANLNIELRCSMEGNNTVNVSTVRCDKWRVL